jgi:hypothetical protein
MNHDNDHPSVREVWLLEQQHLRLMKVVEDDLNEMSRVYERHESEMIFPKGAAAICAALTIGFYLFDEEPAAAMFGALAALGVIIALVKCQTMADIRHRIFETEERLIRAGYGTEWTKKRRRSDIPTATVIRDLI